MILLPTNRISPMTGEHGDVFILANRSRRTCRLEGYPQLAFYAAGRRLPFVEVKGRHAGYVTRRAPAPVVIPPGGQAYFAALKYRCDGKIAAVPTTMYVKLPGGGRSLPGMLSIQASVGAIDYCRRYKGDAHIDPGNYVNISPIVAVPSAAFGNLA
jgi:hypothetical protein